MINDKNRQSPPWSEFMSAIHLVTKNNQSRFRILDRLFWLAWIALPIMTICIFWIVFDPSTYADGLSNEAIACVGKLPLPPNYSSAGKVVLSSIIGFSILFYVLLFAILHRAIRRFRAGNVFDQHTLGSMRWLGILLIGFPIAEFLFENIASSFLVHLEGSGAGSGPSFPDVGPMAFGIFMLALQQVLQNAIAMKTENDLTV